VQNEGNEQEAPFDSFLYPADSTPEFPDSISAAPARCYRATLAPTETAGEYFLSLDNGAVGRVLFDPSVLDSGEPYIFAVSGEGPIQSGPEGLVTAEFIEKVLDRAARTESLVTTQGTSIQLVPTPVAPQGSLPGVGDAVAYAPSSSRAKYASVAEMAAY
ncbi:MAG: hypothetical protein V1820_01170, partial [archaeon]